MGLSERSGFIPSSQPDRQLLSEGSKAPNASAPMACSIPDEFTCLNIRFAEIEFQLQTVLLTHSMGQGHQLHPERVQHLLRWCLKQRRSSWLSGRANSRIVWQKDCFGLMWRIRSENEIRKSPCWTYLKLGSVFNHRSLYLWRLGFLEFRHHRLIHSRNLLQQAKKFALTVARNCL